MPTLTDLRQNWWARSHATSVTFRKDRICSEDLCQSMHWREMNGRGVVQVVQVEVRLMLYTQGG